MRHEDTPGTVEIMVHRCKPSNFDARLVFTNVNLETSSQHFGAVNRKYSKSVMQSGQPSTIKGWKTSWTVSGGCWTWNVGGCVLACTEIVKDSAAEQHSKVGCCCSQVFSLVRTQWLDRSIPAVWHGGWVGILRLLFNRSSKAIMRIWTTKAYQRSIVDCAYSSRNLVQLDLWHSVW